MQAQATQPGRISGPLHPFPIWSCSEWGLPSRPVTRPLVRSYRTVPPLPAEAGGTHFCGTIPEVTLAGRYPAFCPVEPGLSSYGKAVSDCFSHSYCQYFSTKPVISQGLKCGLAVCVSSILTSYHTSNVYVNKYNIKPSVILILLTQKKTFLAIYIV